MKTKTIKQEEMPSHDFGQSFYGKKKRIEFLKSKAIIALGFQIDDEGIMIVIPMVNIYINFK
ncbi:hypothetical protein TM902_180058 [Tenacibaculum maritimum]|uniref:hypothetical protein n=1 Tax=Tenacibaculum maritimum TaxID=107401 RepID=UPI0012E67785|nr:hypothetical protein [Tenacibaculum maritimum]MCD9582300.1 hypothetical protein [Tenacibaculum maritimum]MCD9636682.1 hypothetical protein [Tenacibaculum maritimum]CAA0144782.1 hypothetical protein TM902_180058 [Tenacibaculum maritimum]CAA0193017.1 hypothetical protein USCSE301_250026 [Tenacibaculum maritimum]